MVHFVHLLKLDINLRAGIRQQAEELQLQKILRWVLKIKQFMLSGKLISAQLILMLMVVSLQEVMLN